ncbi:hypothetical protein C1N56_16880 [Pantoea sp. SGAir0175]
MAYCTIFEQMFGFLPGFPTVAVRKALRGEGKRQKAQRNGRFYAHVIDSNNEYPDFVAVIQNVLETPG